MAKQESVLQKQAAEMQVLKESIDKNVKLIPALIADVQQSEVELMTRRTYLTDTQALLAAQRAKLARDANNMHMLIEQAMAHDRDDNPF